MCLAFLTAKSGVSPNASKPVINADSVHPEPWAFLSGIFGKDKTVNLSPSKSTSWACVLSRCPPFIRTYFGPIS